MKQIVRSLVCILALVSLSGCWDSKNLQDLAYGTALGLDIEDGKYIIYTQVQDFTTIAKTEAGPKGKAAPLWIGRSEGKTLTEALTEMYATSQLQVFWGHVKVIIFSEKFLENNKELWKSFDILNRFREFRYNVWVFGTKLPIKDIFTVKSILSLAPLQTILYTPEETHSQRSFISPTYLYRFIRELNESGRPGRLPSIQLAKNNWSQDMKDKPMFRMDGIYFYSGKKFSGWLSEDQLRGLRWMDNESHRTPLILEEDGQPVATLIMHKPRHKIKPILSDNKVRFKITVISDSFIEELNKNASEEQLKKLAMETVKEEIMSTYKQGLQIKTDVYALSDTVYSEYPERWKQLSRGKDFILTEDAIESINIFIRILHSGKYKLKTH